MNPHLSWLGACLLATAFAATSAHAADLTVTVKGARAQPGMVLVALYDSAGAFLKPGAHAKAQMAPAAADASIVFKGLAPGRYALTAFHDENGNGKLDRNLAGTPSEVFGFSRDAMGAGGPPTFEQAVIEVGNDQPIAITINLH